MRLAGFLQGSERLSEIHFLWGSGRGDFACRSFPLNLREEDSGEVSDWLFHEYRICTRPGGHCAPLMHEFFHTERQGMVRFSFFSWKHRGGGAPGGGGLKRDDRAVGLFCLLLFCCHLLLTKILNKSIIALVCKRRAIFMTLDTGKINETYTVKDRSSAEVGKTAGGPGDDGGTSILVLNAKSRGTLIVNVRGTRFALGRGITKQITVR